MIVNNLLLKLKDHSEENVQKTKEVLLGMKSKIEVLLEIQAETNIRPGASAYDIIFFTKFVSLADMEAYLSHPAHLQVAKYIGSVLDTQASICYEIK